MTGRRVAPARDGGQQAITAAASGSWAVEVDGKRLAEGPFRSLLRAQRIAGEQGGKVVPA